MESDQTLRGWLERPGHDDVVISGNFSIGRSPKNTIVLEDQNVSRRHAIINLQNAGEYWLVDLGSSNGTFLNKRRLHQPVRLKSGDQIAIGDTTFFFRQTDEGANVFETVLADPTLRKIENVPCWLLVADIEGFTPLSRSADHDELAQVIGGWINVCRECIERHRGMIDKYLGDGFFAYWREEDTSAADVAAALSGLKEAQARGEPRFRVALHRGSVAIGGVPSMGEESLMGKEVNFVFRMEKLAAALRTNLLLSVEAKAPLQPFFTCESVGHHGLKGFEGECEFFKVAVAESRGQ